MCRQKFLEKYHPGCRCFCSFWDCALSSRTERPPENALSMWRMGTMKKMFWAKTSVDELGAEFGEGGFDKAEMSEEKRLFTE